MWWIFTICLVLTIFQTLYASSPSESESSSSSTKTDHLALIHTQQDPIRLQMSGLEMASFCELTLISETYNPVSRAKFCQSGQPVILKEHTLESPTHRLLAANEVSALAKCQGSPWIVKLLGHFYTNNHLDSTSHAAQDDEEKEGSHHDGESTQSTNLIMVTEYLSGVNLYEVLIKPAMAPLRRRIRQNFALLTAHLVTALAWIHQQDLVHGDFKLANIMVTREGLPKVIDFGFASPTATSNFGRDRSSLIFGTASSLAPETFGRGERGQASDWYALGVLLHEFFTGTELYPTHRVTRPQFKRLVMYRPPNISRRMPAVLADLLGRLLEKRPEDRWGFHRSMDELRGHPFFKDINWSNVGDDMVSPSGVVAVFAHPY